MITPLMDSRFTPVISPSTYGRDDPLTALERSALNELIRARNLAPETRLDAIDNAIRALLAEFAE